MEKLTLTETRETLQEEKAVNEEIVENTREALTELRQLRRQSSIPAMPFITEEPETYLEEAPIAGSSAVDMSASKLEQVAKELDGFSHLLKRERDMWRSEYEQDATRVGSRIMDDDEVECNDKDVDQLQTVLQEIDHKLERVRNGSTRQRNQHVIRRYSRTDSYDSAISGMSTSPIPRYKQHRLPSPTFPRRSETPILQTSLRASVEKSSPTLDSHYDLLAAQISMSPVSSPRLLASSPPTTREHTAATTAVTTPLFDSSSWAAETSTRAPSMLLPSPAVDWSLFCNEVQVKCEGWRKPWVCKLSQRRRMHDCGLSLRAERADGSRFCHDLPASGVAIPHTFHTGANPQYKNAVMFKDIHGHKLRITGQGEYLEKEPKYIFQNPADHKAFQELVFGCELQGSWNVKMIKSEREKESVTQSLRLWRDTHTGTPIILFYTNTRQKSAKTYIQAPSKFTLSNSSGSAWLTR